MMNAQLDSKVYANGRVAKNSVTGAYWNKAVGFDAVQNNATFLRPEQMAVLKTSFQNVEEVLLPTVTDEVAAACNATGKVGYYVNAWDESLNFSCFVLGDNNSVEATRLGDGRYFLRHFRSANSCGFRMVPNVSAVPEVLLEWKNQIEWRGQ